MDFHSPLSAFKAIKKAQDFFEKEVTNSTIKESPEAKKDKQLLEISVTGGRWELFWIKIFATNEATFGSRVEINGKISFWQLTISLIVMLLSGPFFYLILTNTASWILIFPIFLFVLGILSLIMPFIRLHSIIKTLKVILTEST